MKKKHFAELQRISASIPQELLNALIKPEKQFATVAKVLQQGLLEPDEKVPPKEKQRFQEILDSGYLDKIVDVVDPTVEDAIDKWMGFEIEKAVKDGRLPKRADADDLTLIHNKGKQYARRNAARLRKLFTGEDPTNPDSAPQESHLPQERAGREGDAGVLPRGATDGVG